MNPIGLKVNPGDKITASRWNNLVSACNENRQLRAGRGIRIKAGVISATRGNDSFAHPWRMSIGGGSASIRLGLVNGMEPTIKNSNKGDIPMTGKKKEDGSLDGLVPKLAIEDSFFDKKGISFVCVEPTFDDKWKLKSVRLTQVADINSEDGLPSGKTENQLAAAEYPALKNRRTRYPVARLTKVRGVINIYPITYFNLQVIASPSGKSIASEKARFFFFPA